MIQVVFSDSSAADLSALPKLVQLELLSEFQSLTKDLDHLDPDRFGKISGESTSLIRFRTKDYRIYFEPVAEGVRIHRVLHKNTLKDFLFRSKLPMADFTSFGSRL